MVVATMGYTNYYMLFHCCNSKCWLMKIRCTRAANIVCKSLVKRYSRMLLEYQILGRRTGRGQKGLGNATTPIKE